MSQRLRARVEGTVQGVGFRPFVHRLASELALGGFVRNDARGVVLEVEGEGQALEGFLRRLVADAPPLATIDRVGHRPVAPRGEHAFAIAASDPAGRAHAPIAPDVATCPQCLAELRDPADRRYRYPFINCTNCGPRFTIVRGVPYDRPLTTMAAFTMCDRCRAEYDDPGDRRFHAQPNACPDCGPRARLVGAAPGDDAVCAAGALLASGAILAVKGLGGFHLACRADDAAAVARLRDRKRREDRPFAVMVADVEGARSLARVDPEEAELLATRARPIVLVPRRTAAAVASAVAPGLRELGLMLPYTPLHHLLVGDAGGPLVMTSGNRSDEPIAHRDDDALERLAPIADAFLLHDRPIRTRTDDSVARVAALAGRRRPVILRRSRGYVPGALELPVPAPRPILACGAELKNTFCVAAGRRAVVSHHIGDLRGYAALRAYTDGIAHLEQLLELAPEVVACDLHPDYASTAYARERTAEPIRVQHHHAHLAACLAEHGETGPAVGAIFDGAGLGVDGAVWGGELLVGDLVDFDRAGHLWPVALPGGDRAAQEPWRMACSWLVAAEVERHPLPGVPPAKWEQVARLARTGLASPPTSSVGRLFDAVAALCGVRTVATYEGQAAVELEADRDPDEPGAYPLGDELDARPLIRAVAADVAAGARAGVVSARFHRALSGATAEGCARIAAARGLDTVALGGGVWANRALLEQTTAALAARGLRVLVPERLPPGDGGIAFGQAAVAAARLTEAA